MAGTPDTGNPVFDYRAGYRRTAALIQRLLIQGGLLVLFLSGLAFVLASGGENADVNKTLAAISSAVGALLLVSGICWGFYWRRKIRHEFRSKFGLETPAKS